MVFYTHRPNQITTWANIPGWDIESKRSAVNHIPPGSVWAILWWSEAETGMCAGAHLPWSCTEEFLQGNNPPMFPSDPLKTGLTECYQLKNIKWLIQLGKSILSIQQMQWFNTYITVVRIFTSMFLAQNSDWFYDRRHSLNFYFRDIDLPMMKKQALTSTPPDSTCSVLLCWPGLLMPLSWSV